MKIKYKSVTSKIPIVVELPDDIENADEIKKAVIKFRVENTIETVRRKEALNLARRGVIPTFNSGEIPFLLEEPNKNEVILRAIEMLLPKQQDLIDKVYFQGIKITEIAKEEGVTISAISHRLILIYKRLRKILIKKLIDKKLREI